MGELPAEAVTVKLPSLLVQETISSGKEVMVGGAGTVIVVDRVPLHMAASVTVTV